MPWSLSPQELMQSLQCQQLELECITSLGEEILTTCHPDSIITIKSWVTVAKSRFQEVRQVPRSHPCPGEQRGTCTWGKHGPIPVPQPHTSPTTRDCQVQLPPARALQDLGVLSPRGSWPCQCHPLLPHPVASRGHLGPPQPPWRVVAHSCAMAATTQLRQGSLGAVS